MGLSAKKVVIIGAGFAGMNAAKVLARSGVQLIIIDRCNHHLFQPLLYQVATAGLSPADISTPIRSEFSEFKNVQVVLGEVREIVASKKCVRLADGTEIFCDALIVASGARHSYFGADDWEVLAPGLKTLEDAIELRRRILLAFEKAELEVDPKIQQEWLTFVVIGGGPTGVEMAGAIAELARFALGKDFRNASLKNTSVILLEAGDRILSSFVPKLSEAAKKKLQSMGVQVLINHRVTGLSDRSIMFADHTISARTVIWAAGVKASFLGAQLGCATDRSGRVLVNADLSIPGMADIYVVGDLAAVKLPNGGFVPGMAPGAIQQGICAANNVLASFRGKNKKPFKFFDKGSLAAVGRSFALAQIGKLNFYGLFALILWAVVHILFLMSFRNKLLVFVQWTWSFITYKRGARLITGTFGPKS